MRLALVFIPFIFAAVLVLSNRMGGIGTIVSPSIDVQERIAYYASQWRLETALVKAVAKVESNFKVRAKNPADPSYGLMQITPALAYDYGLISNYKDPSWLEIEMIYDINNNLSVACWFMSRLHSKYGFDQAVQSYNVGERGYKIGYRNSDYLEKVRRAYEKYS
ncbi:hypothetical protein ES702_07685 [subsurface metagenome]